VLSSQTIGVEFASKIIKIGTGSRSKRIKLQLWDIAGAERFRLVSRPYYRGAAGAILIYDVSSHTSFAALPTFLMDARTLASPNLTVILAGNKSDLIDSSYLRGLQLQLLKTHPTPASSSGKQLSIPFGSDDSISQPTSMYPDTKRTATVAPQGREVTVNEASDWAARSNIPVTIEVSALSGENVDEVFSRLARIILTKIELGELDPDDLQSGIQYGDGGPWAMDI
jgi:GTPase SAR1 family protein